MQLYLMIMAGFVLLVRARAFMSRCQLLCIPVFGVQQIHELSQETNPEYCKASNNVAGCWQLPGQTQDLIGVYFWKQGVVSCSSYSRCW